MKEYDATEQAYKNGYAKGYQDGQRAAGPYTLVKDGVVCCTSSLPNCGYSTETLKELRAAGFELYQDGQKVKRQ